MPSKMQVRFFVFPTAEELADAAARYFITRIPEETGEAARIAISGGSTPKLMLQMLGSDEYARFADRWENLELYWVDERCVPPDSPDSNYKMTEEALLAWVPLRPEQVHRMEGELAPEEAAARYEAELRNSFRLEGAELPRFDLVMLGLGPDGHTASIFPHTEAVDVMLPLVTANHVAKLDAWRLTLTWPVINQAREVVFLVAGAEKAAILHEVLFGERDPERLPAQLIWPASGKLVFLLDEAAAAKMPREGAQHEEHVWSNVIELDRSRVDELIG